MWLKKVLRRFGATPTLTLTEKGGYALGWVLRSGSYELEEWGVLSPGSMLFVPSGTETKRLGGNDWEYRDLEVRRVEYPVNAEIPSHSEARMTAAAGGRTYEDMIAGGWRGEHLYLQGYIEISGSPWAEVCAGLAGLNQDLKAKLARDHKELREALAERTKAETVFRQFEKRRRKACT